MTANTQSQAIVRVVDDDPDVRRSWQFVIEGEGWNVLTYASALEFLEKDSPFTPGCLVLDVRMPGMSGIELQHEMKLRGDTLPIIFISAHGDIDMAVKTMKDGADDFLSKPVIAHRSSLCKKLGARTAADITRMLMTIDPDAITGAPAPADGE